MFISKMAHKVLAPIAMLAIITLSITAFISLAQEKGCNCQAPALKVHKRYATGHKTPANIKELIAKSWAEHHHKLRALPNVTAPTYDCRTLGIVPPILDQGQCGSCWDFSGTGVVTSALIKAGHGKADGSFACSEQYTLDCGQNNGCNGDDNSTVMAWAKQTGLPLTSLYGPYQAQANPCHYAPSMKLYQLSDWGYCGSQEGVCDTQSIKNAMVQYGPIGAAIAADDAFMNNPPGTVFQGSGSTDINHDIILVGWDDSKQAWILRNSWGTSWCDQGYCYIRYGANQVGTSALWGKATPVTPPTPPPGPNPPGPGPSPSPSPSPVNVTLTLTAPLSAGTYKVVESTSIIAPAGSVFLHPDTVKAIKADLNR